MKNIQMVDLKSQYQKISSEIDKEVIEVIKSTKYINGPKVEEFCNNLKNYMHSRKIRPHRRL